MIFSEPGKIWTTVRVYEGYDELSLVSERTTASSNNIVGRWSIKIPLGSNHTGTLRMYDAYGAQVHSCAALGKSASNASYTVENGNTPPGDYYGYPAGPDADVDAYGPNKYVHLDPNRDEGYENLYVGSPSAGYPRNGILIHGGRSQTTLTPTNGCVRVFNADAKKLTDLMASYTAAGYDSNGYVSITR